MLARRVARRLAVPAAYAVVLALLGTGLWQHVGPHLPLGGPTARSERATAAPAPAGPPPMQAADAPRGPASGLQGAIESVRAFTGDPTLPLTGGRPAEAGERDAGFYYVETAGPRPGIDTFKVDARTAEVIEATFRSRLAPAGASADTSVEEAEQTAERFARQRFRGFDQLALVDRSTRPSEEIPVHSFKWNRIAPSGAELPTSVSVAVSGGSGDVIWYLAQRDPVLVEVHPTVTRERAVETARTWVDGRDGRWDTAEPLAVRLQVLYDDDDRQQLVWSVAFPARPGAGRPSVRLLVHAHNGQIFTPAS